MNEEGVGMLDFFLGAVGLVLILGTCFLLIILIYAGVKWVHFKIRYKQNKWIKRCNKGACYDCERGDYCGGW